MDYFYPIDAAALLLERPDLTQECHLIISPIVSKLFIDQAIFDLDPVQLFQHGFGQEPEEHGGCQCVDCIRRNTGDISGQDHFPVGIGLVHQHGGWIHNTTINQKCRQSAKNT